MTDYPTPDVRNYAILKGNLYFTPTGGERRHLGNCPACEYTPEVETFEHFSSMAGIRTRDFTATLSKTASIALTLEEFTLRNLQLLMLGGEIEDDTEGNASFEIGEADAITGVLEIEGSNDVGPRINAVFYSVKFIPSGALPFISEEMGQFELSGECNAVNGSFGRLSIVGSSGPTE